MAVAQVQIKGCSKEKGTYGKAQGFPLPSQPESYKGTD